VQRIAERGDAIAEQNERDRRGQGEAGPGGERAQIAGAAAFCAGPDCSCLVAIVDKFSCAGKILSSAIAPNATAPVIPALAHGKAKLRFA